MASAVLSVGLVFRNTATTREATWWASSTGYIFSRWKPLFSATIDPTVTHSRLKYNITDYQVWLWGEHLRGAEKGWKDEYPIKRITVCKMDTLVSTHTCRSRCHLQNTSGSLSTEAVNLLQRRGGGGEGGEWKKLNVTTTICKWRCYYFFFEKFNSLGSN